MSEVRWWIDKDKKQKTFTLNVERVGESLDDPYVCLSNEAAQELVRGIKLEQKHDAQELTAADIPALKKAADAFEQHKRGKFAKRLRGWADELESV